MRAAGAHDFLLNTIAINIARRWRSQFPAKHDCYKHCAPLALTIICSDAGYKHCAPPGAHNFLLNTIAINIARRWRSQLFAKHDCYKHCAPPGAHNFLLNTIAINIARRWRSQLFA
ncbi:MAG: hypothetical protein AB7I31_04385, partial [Blastocatellales bacterium]